MKKFLYAVLLCVYILGCKSSGHDMETPADMAGMSPAEPTERVAGEAPGTDAAVIPREGMSGTSVPTAALQKKIIRDGSMTLKVTDLLTARKQVDSMVSAFGGYVGSESFNSYEQESSYILTIRMPAAHFDWLITRLEKGAGEVLVKDIHARDVTEEYIDLEIRLASKRKFIDRYNELLKKAATVNDMLEIGENIRKIEEEIESTEGRLRYLASQVSYSTLTLTLTQEKEFKYKPRHASNFFERLKESLHKGWKGFVSFLLFLIRLWPFWILATIGWVLYRRYKRRKKITPGFKKNH